MQVCILLPEHSRNCDCRRVHAMNTYNQSPNRLGPHERSATPLYIALLALGLGGVCAFYILLRLLRAVGLG